MCVLGGENQRQTEETGSLLLLCKLSRLRLPLLWASTFSHWARQPVFLGSFKVCPWWFGIPWKSSIALNLDSGYCSIYQLCSWRSLKLFHQAEFGLKDRQKGVMCCVPEFRPGAWLCLPVWGWGPWKLDRRLIPWFQKILPAQMLPSAVLPPPGVASLWACFCLISSEFTQTESFQRSSNLDPCVWSLKHL